MPTKQSFNFLKNTFENAAKADSTAHQKWEAQVLVDAAREIIAAWTGLADEEATKAAMFSSQVLFLQALTVSQDPGDWLKTVLPDSPLREFLVALEADGCLCSEGIPETLERKVRRGAKEMARVCAYGPCTGEELLADNMLAYACKAGERRGGESHLPFLLKAEIERLTVVAAEATATTPS